MERIKIYAEIGSCHSGKSEYIREAIDRCVEYDIDAIKFQLFPNAVAFTGTGNVWLSPEQYLEAKEYAGTQIQVGASVFGEEEFDFLLDTNPDFIKFAYSQKERVGWIEEALAAYRKVIVSCDVMSDHDVPKDVTKLFCISRYPVYEQISFNDLFPRFDGFSDHTLGYRQTLKAVEMGAKCIEKHFKLNHSDIKCPDSYFALTPQDLKYMVRAIRSLERAIE